MTTPQIFASPALRIGTPGQSPAYRQTPDSSDEVSRTRFRVNRPQVAARFLDRVLVAARTVAGKGHPLRPPLHLYRLAHSRCTRVLRTAAVEVSRPVRRVRPDVLLISAGPSRLRIAVSGSRKKV